MTLEQYTAWEKLTWVIFEMFLQRKGWTAEQTAFEIARMKEAGFGTDLTEDDLTGIYFRMSRVGGTKRLNRNDRMGVILTYQNACNHASIEIFEMNE